MSEISQYSYVYSINNFKSSGIVMAAPVFWIVLIRTLRSFYLYCADRLFTASRIRISFISSRWGHSVHWRYISCLVVWLVLMILNLKPGFTLRVWKIAVIFWRIFIVFLRWNHSRKFRLLVFIFSISFVFVIFIY